MKKIFNRIKYKTFSLYFLLIFKLVLSVLLSLVFFIFIGYLIDNYFHIIFFEYGGILLGMIVGYQVSYYFIVRDFKSRNEKYNN